MLVSFLRRNWADWNATRRHYELMARYVHPHFQKSIEPRTEAYRYAASHYQEFSAESAAAVNAEIVKRTAPLNSKPTE